MLIILDTLGSLIINLKANFYCELHRYFMLTCIWKFLYVPARYSPRPSTWWVAQPVPLSCSSQSCTDYGSYRSQRSWCCSWNRPDSYVSPSLCAPCWAILNTSFRKPLGLPCISRYHSWKINFTVISTEFNERGRLHHGANPNDVLVISKSVYFKICLLMFHNLSV